MPAVGSTRRPVSRQPLVAAPIPRRVRNHGRSGCPTPSSGTHRTAAAPAAPTRSIPVPRSGPHGWPPCAAAPCSMLCPAGPGGTAHAHNPPDDSPKRSATPAWPPSASAPCRRGERPAQATEPPCRSDGRQSWADSPTRRTGRCGRRRPAASRWTRTARLPDPPRSGRRRPAASRWTRTARLPIRRAAVQRGQPVAVAVHPDRIGARQRGIAQRGKRRQQKQQPACLDQPNGISVARRRHQEQNEQIPAGLAVRRSVSGEKSGVGNMLQAQGARQKELAVQHLVEVLHPPRVAYPGYAPLLGKDTLPQRPGAHRQPGRSLTNGVKRRKVRFQAEREGRGQGVLLRQPRCRHAARHRPIEAGGGQQPIGHQQRALLALDHPLQYPQDVLLYAA